MQKVYIYLMILFFVSLFPAMAKGSKENKKESKMETIAKEEPGEIEGYIHIIGLSRESYESARVEATTQLLYHLGLVNIDTRTFIDLFSITDGFEKTPNERYTPAKVKDVSSKTVNIYGSATLPPLGKIILTRQDEYYCCHFYLESYQKFLLMNILEIVKHFPYDASKDGSIMDFYSQKILVIQTMFTSRQAVELANQLEQSFFISTHTIQNLVYIFPRDRVEFKIVNYLSQHFEQVSKNGNEIRVNFPNYELMERKFDLRSMIVKSNMPVPELNHILKKNGLSSTTEKAEASRFFCVIEYREVEKDYSRSAEVEVQIFDRLDYRCLLSDTLITKNYASYYPGIINIAKQELVDFLDAKLPLILIDY